MNPIEPLWYPYAPLGAMSAPLEIAGATGAYLKLADGRTLIDALSSWWCMIHGYNHPALNQAIQDQVQQFSHVMMGGLTHQPARQLAHELCRLYEGMEGCFFGDSGSVGVEIALKMAAQYHSNYGRPHKKKIVALQGAYHGDTYGAMAVGSPDAAMRTAFGESALDVAFVEAPNGWPATNLSQTIAEVEALFVAQSERIAAVIVEPIMQGYGGFKIYDPSYLKSLRQLCDQYEIVLIFDEVATGFGRLGKRFAAEIAGVIPDIAVLGKGLSGGYLGLSATLANGKIYRAFHSTDPAHAFMHGPTFMGNPLACAVALRSVQLFDEEYRLEDIARIESIFAEEFAGWSNPCVKEVRILGALLVLETEDAQYWAGLREWAAQRGVWTRPFREFVYATPPYVIQDHDLRTICRVYKEWFELKSATFGL